MFAHKTEMSHFWVQIFQMRISREQQQKQLLIQISDELGPNVFNECSEQDITKKQTNDREIEICLFPRDLFVYLLDVE